MSNFEVPSHEINTPIGHHKVVLKDFISGYDDEAIEAIYTRGRHKVQAVDPNDPDAKPDNTMEIDGSAIQDAERETVKRTVLSVDGKTGTPEEILDLVYQMHKTDTAYVKLEGEKVVHPPEDKPAKKSKGKTTTPDS